MRATAGPHIMPCPHELAIVTPPTSLPSRSTSGTQERKVVRCVLDRGRPRLLDPEVCRDRHQPRQATLHALEVGPIDRSTGAGRFLRVGHAPEQAAFLGTPVEAGVDVEGHGAEPLGRQLLVRLADHDLVPRVAHPRGGSQRRRPPPPSPGRTPRSPEASRSCRTWCARRSRPAHPRGRRASAARGSSCARAARRRPVAWPVSRRARSAAGRPSRRWPRRTRLGTPRNPGWGSARGPRRHRPIEHRAPPLAAWRCVRGPRAHRPRSSR